jgi:hypothetical protein
MENRKPYWYEIEQKRRGDDIIPKELLWQREFYVIVYNNHRAFSVRHYEYVNSFIQDLKKDNVPFYWLGCGNKKQAYDIKEMMQKRYMSLTGSGKVDRIHQEEVKKWKY